MKDRKLTRRHVLQLLGVSAAVPALGSAACSRSEEAAESGSSFHAAYPFLKPPKGNYNYLGGVTDQISMGYLFDLMFVPGATYLWADERFHYLLADDSSELSADGRTFTYKVRDGLTWSDGKPVTAKDVYTTWLLRAGNGHEVFDYVESFEQTDDMTVTFTIGTPAPISEYYLLRERPVSDAVYGKWAREIEPLIKAGKRIDDKGVADIVERVHAFKPDAAVVSGPFEIDYHTVANARLTMVKNNKGYLADQINFDEIIVYNGETASVTPILLQKEIDYATHGFPPETESRLESSGYHILRPPIYSGPGLFINHKKLPEFADKRVRQAFAHAIDRAQAAKVSMDRSAVACELMTGMSDTQVPLWVAEADQAKFNHYELDLDKAEQLLTEAGWSNTGGTWHTAEGKEAAYDLLTASDYFNWAAAAQNLESQLGEFGIKISVRGVESTQHSVFTEEGSFELAIRNWGVSSNPYPSAAFRAVLMDINYPELTPFRGIDYPLEQDTDIVGHIDLEQAIIDAGLGASDDALKANVTKVALAFNELLPVIPLFERLGNNPVLQSRIAGWPSDDDPIYANSPYADNFTTILMYEGKLKPA